MNRTQPKRFAVVCGCGVEDRFASEAAARAIYNDHEENCFQDTRLDEVADE